MNLSLLLFAIVFVALVMLLWGVKKKNKILIIIAGILLTLIAVLIINIIYATKYTM